MVHISTGNRLDVVYDYENGRKTLHGLKQHGSEITIPLLNPHGLVNVLTQILAEIERDNKPS